MPALIYVKGREQPVPVLESYDELIGQVTSIDPLHWKVNWIRATYLHKFFENEVLVGTAKESVSFQTDNIDFIGEWKEAPDPLITGERTLTELQNVAKRSIGEFRAETADPPRPVLRPPHTLPEDIEQ